MLQQLQFFITVVKMVLLTILLWMMITFAGGQEGIKNVFCMANPQNLLYYYLLLLYSEQD